MLKKFTKLLIITIVGILALTGCTGKKTDDSVLKIGATAVPHAEILNLIKEDLENDGVKLEIIEFNDYVKPNLALANKEIDANYFQHIPYLEDFAKEHELDLEILCGVHIEPLGVYSDKITEINIKEIPVGSTVAIPNDSVNQGRALLLLQENGLIKLDEKAGLTATELDITVNTLNLKFKPLEAAQIPRVLQDVDLAVINGNFALGANLNPIKDALLLEDGNSPYVNIIAIRTGEANDEKLQKLKKHLQTDKVKKYIEENYNGGVVSAFSN